MRVKLRNRTRFTHGEHEAPRRGKKPRRREKRASSAPRPESHRRQANVQILHGKQRFRANLPRVARGVAKYAKGEPRAEYAARSASGLSVFSFLAWSSRSDSRRRQAEYGERQLWLARVFDLFILIPFAIFATFAREIFAPRSSPLRPRGRVPLPARAARSRRMSEFLPLRSASRFALRDLRGQIRIRVLCLTRRRPSSGRTGARFSGGKRKRNGGEAFRAPGFGGCGTRDMKHETRSWGAERNGVNDPV